jgi:hypothetical protein
MTSLTEDFIERYYDEYDDTDRYFDYVHKLYEHITSFSEEHSLLILDNNNFSDFFEFCVDHMNYDVIDHRLINAHIGKLRHEVGKLFVEPTLVKHVVEVFDNEDNLQVPETQTKIKPKIKPKPEKLNHE